MSEKPSRAELIALCEAAIVPEERWCDRDSAGAQKQIGEVWALLRAGCAFEFKDDMEREGTWWITVTYRGFGAFDWDGLAERDLFYIPTPQRLARTEGRDWY